MIQQRDLLALQLSRSALLLGDVLHENIGGIPVGAEQREIPLEDTAVHRFRTAVTGGQQRNLVERRLFGEGEGDARRQWRESSRPCGALSFQALIAFNPAVRRVPGLALLGSDFYPVDATVPFVHQGQVIRIPVGEWHAIGSVGPRPVHQQRKKLFVGLGHRRYCRSH